MKRRSIVICIMLSLLSIGVKAQNYKQVVGEIEKNNLTLKGLRHETEANVLMEKATNNLANPEVEGAYYWGHPSSIGERQDLRVTQSFDFPTAYHFRKGVANANIRMHESNYSLKRADILLQARELCVEIIYLNALIEESAVRQENARQLEKGTEQMYVAGAVNVISRNKAKLYLTNAETDYNNLEAERKAALVQLQSLNGGVAIELTDKSFPAVVAPEDFNLWFTTNHSIFPMNRVAEANLEAAEKGIKLSQTNNLPKLNVGYALENVVGQRFQGATLGLSIPLWENRHQVKQAVQRKMASENFKEEIANIQKAQFEEIYVKLLQLQYSSTSMRNALKATNDRELLKKAYDKGEISLIEYVLELDYYFDAFTKAIEMEREFQKQYCKLTQYN